MNGRWRFVVEVSEGTLVAITGFRLDSNLTVAAVLATAAAAADQWRDERRRKVLAGGCLAVDVKGY